MGAQLRGFSCVAVRMLGCVRRCKGAQGWACRLMGQRVYGTRMSRWIRRSVDVQVRGSEDARVCKRVWRVKRASMLIGTVRLLDAAILVRRAQALVCWGCLSVFGCMMFSCVFLDMKVRRGQSCCLGADVPARRVSRCLVRDVQVSGWRRCGCSSLFISCRD